VIVEVNEAEVNNVGRSVLTSVTVTVCVAAFVCDKVGRSVPGSENVVVWVCDCDSVG